MGSKTGKSYSREFKAQILKECMETNQYNVVARKHNVPVTTVYTWIKRDKTISKTQTAKGRKALTSIYQLFQEVFLLPSNTFCSLK